MSIFKQIGISERPIMLAPLAGVSDYPFRMACYEGGADLAYVEMLSATAIVHRSKRTFDMMRRHPSEPVLGVQVTSKTAEEMGEALRIIEDMSFETVDINMGCPVRKVVGSGAGSGILKDLKRLEATCRAAREATKKPLSIKIRLGWDHHSRNFLDVGKIAEDTGIDFMTMHGRTRCDDYSVPVDLDAIAELKTAVKIPVVANGNLFTPGDAEIAFKTGVDGLMVSRGSMGNPWIFNEIKGVQSTLGIEKWFRLVLKHFDWQFEAYGESSGAAVRMRKHLLWYVKGWYGSKKVRGELSNIDSIDHGRAALLEFYNYLKSNGFTERLPLGEDSNSEERFQWDPKYEMDRQIDRSVYEE